MALQLVDFRNLTLQWLDDVNAGYFTTATVNLWLNNAQRECQKQLLQASENYYRTSAQTSTVASQADYVNPSDFLKLHRLELVLSGTGVNEDKRWIQPITENEQDQYNNGIGIPEVYILKRERITLIPIPDKAYVLRLAYSYRAADMVNDTDIPDVPPEFEEFLSILATIDGLAKDNRASPTIASKYQMYMDRFKKMAEDRKQDRSRQVIQRDVAGYGICF